MSACGYQTLSTRHPKEGSQAFGYVAIGCAMLGAFAGFLVSSGNTNLYAAVSSKPVQVAPAYLPARAIQNRFEVATPAFGRESGEAMSSATSSSSATPVAAMIGGVAIAAAAAVAAIAMKMFRGARASDVSGLARYQDSEARWSMMAASAFVGTSAPDFEATAVFDQEFVDVKLSQYRGKKYVVLFFYPLDFTFVCPTEITAFSDRAAEFEAIDTQILGVSVDSQFSHLAWIQTPRNQGGLGEINYPLVADLKKQIAESYGVLTEEGVALRGLFIIDKEGIIQHATINNLAFGRNVDETLRVLEAVQHVQANPDEVCPAGWKKGDKTMKPDPEGSKEYFKAI